MAKSASERIGGLLNAVESRWSLWALINASGLVAFISFPAWAVRAAGIFSQYAPFSWVVAGIGAGNNLDAYPFSLAIYEPSARQNQI
jgi:hypothetical protein